MYRLLLTTWCIYDLHKSKGASSLSLIPSRWVIIIKYLDVESGRQLLQIFVFAMARVLYIYIVVSNKKETKTYNLNHIHTFSGDLQITDDVYTYVYYNVVHARHVPYWQLIGIMHTMYVRICIHMYRYSTSNYFVTVLYKLCYLHTSLITN